MKNAPTLEQERREVLDRIHASRAEYRRKLLASEISERQKARNGGKVTVIDTVRDNVTNGVRTGVRSAADHPAVTVAAVVALVGVAVLAKRAYDHSTYQTPAQKLGSDLRSAKDRIAEILRPGYERLKSTRIVQKSDLESPSSRTKSGAIATAGMTLAASVITMMLRDPMRMRLAGRLFGAAVGYARKRTSSPSKRTR
jgi:hypothetical protein